MPLDVPPKKDVHKEGDKPQSQADTDAARMALVLEATKPGHKAEVKSEVKPAAKPEATKDGDKKPEVKASATDDSLTAYLYSGIDKASSLLTSAAAMLPTLAIEDNSKAVTTTAQMDVSKFLNQTCTTDAASKACPTPAASDSIGGFKMASDKPLVENTYEGDLLTGAKQVLTTKDWQSIIGAYNTEAAKANSVEHTKDGQVHRDAKGNVDVIRTLDASILKTLDGGQIISTDAGDKIKKDKDGRELLSFDKDHNFTGILESGRRVSIANGSNEAKILDANGKEVFSFDITSGKLKTTSTYSDTQVHTSADSIKDVTDLNSTTRYAVERAKETGLLQVIQMDGGVVAADKSGSYMALQNDGTALVSMEDGKFLVRDAKGKLAIYSKDGKPPVQLSDEFMAKIRTSKDAELKAMRQAYEALTVFARTHSLKAANGAKTTLSLNGQTVTANVEGTVSTSQTNGIVTNTDLATGDKQVIDSNKGTVEMQNANGTVDRLGTNDKGQIRVKTNEYTYDGGVVTTKDGDVITADHVRMANGTEIDSHNNVHFADGSIMSTDGTYTTSRARAEMLIANQAAEGKAASIAGYAQSLAGAMMSRAASGNVSASDIASLESVFAGLCDAVTSLGMCSDPSVAFKLYAAKGTVSESISTGLSNLHANKAA